MTMSTKRTASADRTKPDAVQLAATRASASMVPAVVPRSIAAAGMPKPGRRLWLWALTGVLAIGLAVLLSVQYWAGPVTRVTVETVLPGPVTRVLAVNGRIAGERSVELRAQVSGILAEVLVAEGDIVQAGTIVARIDAAAQQAAVRQAMAGLDAAQVAEADVQATYARTLALGDNAARMVLESAARAVQSAMQEVARSKALLDQATIQLQKFTIRAPLSGSVLVLTADPGASVDPSTVLMTIVDLGQLVIKTDVDESYATQIKVGQRAALQLAGSTEVLAGRVGLVAQIVDADTGGLAVKLIPDAALIAPVGLTVTANITVEDHPAAITAPRTAIVTDAAGDSVLVVAEGVATRRAIQVIDWPAARLIVTAGLIAGDVLITDVTGLADGQAVEVSR